MCVEFLAKYILFFFNLVFWLVSVTLIGVGIAVLNNVDEIVDQLPVNLSAIPIVVIVAGAILFVITFSGCCGAIRESRCLLITYAVIMLVLAAAMSYLAYVVLGNLDALPTTVGEWMDEIFDKSIQTTPNEFTVIESAFQCCGARGVDSYTKLNLAVPPTCCPQPVNNTCEVDFTYKGCAARLGEYLEAYGYGVGVVIVIIIVIEVLAMIMALYLNSAVTRKNRDRRNVY